MLDTAQATDSDRAKIWINENDSSGLEVTADETFKDGDRLPCGLVALNLENQKSCRIYLRKTANITVK